MGRQLVQVAFPRRTGRRITLTRKGLTVADIPQTVQVAFPIGSRRYTYRYMFDPLAGRMPLAVGDVVQVPDNVVSPDGDGTAVVVALGSDYDGPMKSITRKIEEDTL